MVVASWSSILQTHTHRCMNGDIQNTDSTPAHVLICTVSASLGVDGIFRGFLSQAVVTFDRPLHRRTVGAGGEG